MCQEAARRFKPQEATADDRRAPAALGVVGDTVAVVDRTKQEGAGPTEAVHGRHEGPGTGGDDDVVVRRLDKRGVLVAGRIDRIGQGVLLERRAHHDAALAVDASGPDAGVQRDAVVAIPRKGIHEDVRRGLRTVEHVTQEDPVVIAVGLGSEPMSKRSGARFRTSSTTLAPAIPLPTTTSCARFITARAFYLGRSTGCLAGFFQGAGHALARPKPPSAHSRGGFALPRTQTPYSVWVAPSDRSSHGSASPGSRRLGRQTKHYATYRELRAASMWWTRFRGDPQC